MTFTKFLLSYEFDGQKYTDEYIASDVRAALKGYRKLHPEFKNVKKVKELGEVIC
jgi:hypothetical protein